ncbi:hypothetical protein ACIPSA_45085 [Streptomyces sp. NPDC086549]|uniref:hypothetical protein n=1 Tax=Streptomyces sp. NPDC086549 TaxID=3365752 RepID=UPI00380CA47E
MTAIRATQFIVVGTALSLASVACSASSGEATHPTRSASPQATTLNSLPQVDLTGKISDIATPVLSQTDGHAIAQTRSGPDYLVAYTTGHACGLLAIRPDNPQPVQINITAHWPKNASAEPDNLPGGPYLIATATSATPGGFASLHCGTHSEVIEYSSRAAAPKPETPSTLGPVSVVKPATAREPLIVSIGSADTRRDVITHYQSAQR